MFDAVSDLKTRLELVKADFYEKWHMQDYCDWLVPEGTVLEEFLANQAREREKEVAAVSILEMLRNAIETVPSSIIERTGEFCSSIGQERYAKIAFGVIHTVGLEFDPVDATEFVKSLNGLLFASGTQGMLYSP
jgi:hypothetical protein